MDVSPPAADLKQTASFSVPEVSLSSRTLDQLHYMQPEEEVSDLQFVAILSSN